MKKLIIVCFGLLSLSLHAMEGDDRFAPSEWRSRRLQSLLDEAKSPTCNEFNQHVREVKKAFVYKYLDKYEGQQEVLSYLLRETKGVVRATTDPELANKDSSKFLCIDPLQSTADEIDLRGKCIHHADCKYISESIEKYGSYEGRGVTA